jgi:hypothetical protein
MSLVNEDYTDQIRNSFIQYLKQSKRTKNCRVISNFQRVKADRSIYISSGIKQKYVIENIRLQDMDEFPFGYILISIHNKKDKDISFLENISKAPDYLTNKMIDIR